MSKILIPAKAESKRCPHKNFVLLPFVNEWLKAEGRHGDAIVIYDSEEMRDLAASLGLSTFEEIRPHGGDNEAAADCAYCIGEEYFIRLPLTQPLRSHNLLADMEAASKGRNLVVSAQISTDRRLFDIAPNGDFLLQSSERKGCMCEERLMVDGAAYLCKTEWARSVKTNHEFWSEPFVYAINHAPFLDIDTQEDMQKFLNLLNIMR